MARWSLAQRALREAGDDFEQRLDYVTTRLLARGLVQGEREVARRTYQKFLAHYEANEEEGEKLLAVGESPPDQALGVATSAAWTMLTSQMMNLDEVLNK